MPSTALASFKYLSIALSTAVLAACSADSQNQAPLAPVEVVSPVDTGDVEGEDPTEPRQQVSLKFENNFQGWLDTLTSDAITIDFESVASTSRRLINGDEFNQFAGGPEFSLIEGSGMFVGDPSDESQPISAVSGINSFFMGCDPTCDGIVRVDFATPINAFGAFFIDVEEDFASTGFSLSDAEMPEFAFSREQGQNVQGHLGFTSDTPFSSVFIHFSTGPTVDGAAMDDMSYVVATGSP